MAVENEIKLHVGAKTKSSHFRDYSIDIVFIDILNVNNDKHDIYNFNIILLCMSVNNVSLDSAASTMWRTHFESSVWGDRTDNNYVAKERCGYLAQYVFFASWVNNSS